MKAARWIQTAYGRHPRWTIAGGVLLVLLAIGALGGGDDDDKTVTAGSPATTAAPATEPRPTEAPKPTDPPAPKATTVKVDEDAAIDTLVRLYGPCFAEPGFPQADAETVRSAAVVKMSQRTDDGWVPVQVLLQNSASGREAEPTFRINPTQGVGQPSYGDKDALAVLAKCP